jgi:hypothetical protein
MREVAVIYDKTVFSVALFGTIFFSLFKKLFSSLVICRDPVPYFFVWCVQLPGILSISSRLLPTVMNLLRRLAEEAQGRPTPEAPMQQSFSFQNNRNQTQLNPTSSTIPESSESSSCMSSTDSEYSSPNLMHRLSTKISEEEFS